MSQNRSVPGWVQISPRIQTEGAAEDDSLQSLHAKVVVLGDVGMCQEHVSPDWTKGNWWSWHWYHFVRATSWYIHGIQRRWIFDGGQDACVGMQPTQSENRHRLISLLGLVDGSASFPGPVEPHEENKTKPGWLIFVGDYSNLLETIAKTVIFVWLYIRN